MRLKLATNTDTTEGNPVTYAGAPPRDPLPTPPDPDFGMTHTGAVVFLVIAAVLVMLHWGTSPCVR